VSLLGLWVGLDERRLSGLQRGRAWVRAGPEGGLPVIPSPGGGGMECFGVPGGWGQSS
jgi:hypothetical protein